MARFVLKRAGGDEGPSPAESPRGEAGAAGRPDGDCPDGDRAARKQAKLAAKADKRAAKVQLAQVKTDQQRIKAEQKQADKQLKAEQKRAKAEQKAKEKGEHGTVTPGNAKKIVGVVKVIGPALAPYAAQAAAGAREGYERMRAHRLGIPVADLGRFTGKGAALHARIAGNADALGELREKAAKSPADSEQRVGTEKFVESAEQRLEQLTSAVRAAERMPTSRRRSAHRSVSGELSRIEDDIMNRLGVSET